MMVRDMKLIELTQGQVTKVDDYWYPILCRFTWCARWSKFTNSFYAMRSVYYADNAGKQKTKTILMHRVISQTPHGLVCDHINNDTLDNQESNLRSVTFSQNQMNRKGGTRNSISGIRGVSWNAKKSKWQAQVGNKYLGVFSNIKEAEKVVIEERGQQYGEHSK